MTLLIASFNGTVSVVSRLLGISPKVQKLSHARAWKGMKRKYRVFILQVSTKTNAMEVGRSRLTVRADDACGKNDPSKRGLEGIQRL